MRCPYFRERIRYWYKVGTRSSVLIKQGVLIYTYMLMRVCVYINVCVTHDHWLTMHMVISLVNLVDDLLVCLLLTKCFFFCTNIQQHTLTNNRILFPGKKLWEKFSERKSGLKLQSNHYPSSLVTNHALSPTHCVQRLCTPFTELPTTSSTSSHSWPRPRPNHVTWEWNGISRH